MDVVDQLAARARERRRQLGTDPAADPAVLRDGRPPRVERLARSGVDVAALQAG